MSGVLQTLDTTQAELFVYQLYRLALRRSPDKSGRDYFESALISGRLSCEQVAQEVMESAEYALVNQLHRERAPSQSLPRVCFIHIEKTAGTSIHEYLTETYGAESIFPERLRYLERYEPAQFRAYRLYSGHYTLRNCWRLPQDTQYITFLREPRERIVSLYYFWRSLSVTVDNPAALVAQNCNNFEEFLTHPLTRQAIHDVQLYSVSDDNAAAVQDARAALDRFAFVGLREQFCLSSLMLAARFGWHPPSRIHRRMAASDLASHPNHQRRVEREPMTKRLGDLLDACTVHDQVLYQQARRRFEQQMESAFFSLAAATAAV